MNLPCDTCIVDPMCIKACPDFKKYLSKVYVSDFISNYKCTPARSRRIYKLAKYNVEYYIYFFRLLKKDIYIKKIK